MAKERKRVERKPVKPVVPKKRPEPIIEVKPKVKPSNDKYVKVESDAGQEAFRAIGERVQRGEVKWGYYASGTHYYIILNN